MVPVLSSSEFCIQRDASPALRVLYACAEVYASPALRLGVHCACAEVYAASPLRREHKLEVLCPTGSEDVGLTPIVA